MLSLHYHKLTEMNEKHKERKYLIVDDMLDKVLDKIKRIIGIEHFDNTKILTDTDDKFPFDISFKKVVIIMTCVIKDNNKFNPQNDAMASVDMLFCHEQESIRNSS